MSTTAQLLTVLLFGWLTCGGEALIDRLYCGKNNCYDLLELSRDASPADVRKAYRKLAMRYHPDKNKKKGSREKFEELSNAYEVLKDEEERANYDYMLDHPEEVYGHYYRYYARRTPKVDIRWVVTITVLVISVVQYFSWWQSHQRAVDAALKMPKYRIVAKDMALSRGLLEGGGRKKKGGGGGGGGKEAREEEEAILRSIIEDNLNITGGYRKPRLLDVLLFRILLLPYTLLLYFWWYGKWVWRFNIQKEPYGPEEIEYLTRRALKLSATHWEEIDSDQRETLLEKELWIKENLTEWRQEQMEEARTKFADSSKHKMYRRYMKSRGKSTAIPKES